MSEEGRRGALGAGGRLGTGSCLPACQPALGSIMLRLLSWYSTHPPRAASPVNPNTKPPINIQTPSPARLPPRPPPRPGASEEALDAAEAALGVPLPPALRALYRCHDGQALEFDRQIDSGRTEMHPSVFHGLFGGCAVCCPAVCCPALLRAALLSCCALRQPLSLACRSAPLGSLIQQLI